MDRWQNKIAVITGAGSGMGASTTKALIEANVIVVGLDKNVQRVEDLRSKLPKGKSQNLHPIQCDVTDLASVTAAFQWVEEHLGGVDIMINNAGIIKSGQLCEMDPKDVETVVKTNIMGYVYCTQFAFKSMKKRNFAGHIVLINSIVGHSVISGVPGTLPDFNIYSPSKYAVTAMTEIYRQEFNGLGTKVKITSISPGVVETNLFPYSMQKEMGDIKLRPEDITQCILFALSTPAHVQIHDIIAKPMGEIF